MNRHKKAPTRASKPEGVGPAAEPPLEPDSTAATTNAGRLTPAQQGLVSGCLVVHLGILLLSLSANLSPSFLQLEMLSWTSMYSVTTAQDYGAVPLEWTHGESLDFPMLIEVHQQGQPQDRWTTLELPNVTVSSQRPVQWSASRWSNVSRSVRLLYNDTQASEILAELAARRLATAPESLSSDVDRIRVVSAVVVDYAQHQEAMANQLSIAEAFDDEVLFVADVLKTTNGQVVLVPAEEAMRTSKAQAQIGGQTP